MPRWRSPAPGVIPGDITATMAADVGTVPGTLAAAAEYPDRCAPVWGLDCNQHAGPCASRAPDREEATACQNRSFITSAGTRIRMGPDDGGRVRQAEPGDYDAIAGVIDEWWGRPVLASLPRLFFDLFHRTSLVTPRGRPGGPGRFASVTRSGRGSVYG